MEPAKVLQDANKIMIPCEECGANVAFEEYMVHMDEHKAKRRQLEEEKSAIATIPCDICGIGIAFSEYESHIKTHQSSAPVPVQASIASPSNPYTTCSVCGAIYLESTHLASNCNGIIPPASHPPAKEEKKAPEPIICRVCGMSVTCEEYESHILTHDLAKDNSISSISKLPSHESQLLRTEYTGKGTETECKICLVNYVAGDKLIYLPCSHFYHEKCILAWFQKVESAEIIPTCPECQSKVFC